MNEFGYPEAVHALLQLNLEIVLGGANTSWYLRVVHMPDNPIASIPIIVRFDKKKPGQPAMRRPWPPNNADLHSKRYRRKDGQPLEHVVFQEGTCAWAFDQLLRHGRAVRRVDWPAGMRIQDVDLGTGRSVCLITLQNGKRVEGEFHPDFADVAGEWELFSEL